MRIATFALLFALLTQPAFAETSNADRNAFETIISAQINAFRADDGAGAFAFASPGLQAKFRDASTFLDMVRSGYGPVYRPRTFEFRNIVDHGSGPEQQVFVVGPDGRGYIAHYTMERQPDGSWRIGGCYLERANDEGV